MSDGGLHGERFAAASLSVGQCAMVGTFLPWESTVPGLGVMSVTPAGRCACCDGIGRCLEVTLPAQKDVALRLCVTCLERIAAVLRGRPL